MEKTNQAPYQDSSVSLFEIEAYSTLQNVEFVRQTYLSQQPIFRGYLEFSFCTDTDCTAMQFQEKKTNYEMNSMSTIWYRKGKRQLFSSAERDPFHYNSFFKHTR